MISTVPKNFSTGRGLATLFAGEVATAETRSHTVDQLVHPDDLLSLGSASAKRSMDFFTGRACARAALIQLGYKNIALPIGSDRRPIWPIETIGSITHTNGFIGAAVVSRKSFVSIGIDAEGDSIIDSELWRLLFTDADINLLSAESLKSQNLLARIVFSAKETFYKCQFEVTKTWLDFTDVSVEVNGAGFCIKPLTNVGCELRERWPLTGAYTIFDDVVLTGMTLANE